MCQNFDREISELLNEYEKAKWSNDYDSCRLNIIRKRMYVGKEDCDFQDNTKVQQFLKTISVPRRTMSTAEIYNFIYSTYPLKFGEDWDNEIKQIREFIRENIVLGIIEDSKTSENANHNCELSKLTMNYILENVTTKNMHCSIKQRLKEALRFFSRTELFGEIGSFLIRRIESSEIESRDRKTYFYFKHDYFIHSINDYNLINALDVIEKNETEANKIYICEIQYGDSISEQKTICGIPVEIRISDKDGSEYVAYYLPVERIYGFIKADFINNINIYKYTKLSEEQERQIREDLKRVKKRLKKIWGIMPGIGKYSGIAGDASEENYVETVDIVFRVKEGEYYIKPRIEKEIRYGEIISESKEDSRQKTESVTVRIPVLNKEELYTWIRSFYGRVIQVRCNSDQSDSGIIEILRKETKDMYDKLKEPNEKIKEMDQSYIKEAITERPCLKKSLMRGDEEKEEISALSEQLFHVVFGAYYEDMGNIVLKCVKDRKCLKERECKKIYETYPVQIVKKDTMWNIYRNICECIKHWGLTVNDDQMMYLYNILPLTNIERRWILTILKEPKMKLFLSKKEREEISKQLVGNNTTLYEFPLKIAVNHFDRYKRPEISEDEITHFQTILRAIHEKKRILALYRTSYNKTIVSLVIPTRIEYSKRDDVFRFICMEEKAVNENRDATYTLNLERIVKVRIIENNEEFWTWRNGGKKIVITDYGKIFIKFNFKELVKEEQEYFNSGIYIMEEKWKANEIDDHDFNAAVETVSEQLKREKRAITITFPYDEEKTDQILTEFSPWKKVCSRSGNLYELTIYYPDSELSDITIRLLSYGNYITIKEEKERIDIEKKKEQPKKKQKPDGENNKTQPLYQDTFWNISRDNRLEKGKKENQNIQRRSIKSEFEKRLGNQLEIWKEREQQQERENGLDEPDR